MLRLPPTIYFAFTDFGAKLGIGCVGDFVTDIEDAADQLSECSGARVLRIDFDVSTNSPESVSDVTEDCEIIVARRCYERGIEDAA